MKLALLVVLVLVLASLLLAACDALGIDEEDLSREAGEQAREEVDNVLSQIGEFVAGFCSSSLAPIAAVGLVLVARSARVNKHHGG